MEQRPTYRANVALDITLEITVRHFQSTALAIALTLAGCSQAPGTQRVVIPGPFFLRSGAHVTVKAPEPLRTPNYFNALCTQPVPPLSLARDLPAGLLTPTGKLVRPSVRLRNAVGIEDSFDVLGNLGGEGGLWLCFHPAAGTATHSPYTEVVFVSPDEIQIEAIRWYSSDKSPLTFRPTRTSNIKLPLRGECCLPLASDVKAHSL